jgi:O-antigen/teichoic acid export membrane protein
MSPELLSSPSTWHAAWSSPGAVRPRARDQRTEQRVSTAEERRPATSIIPPAEEDVPPGRDGAAGAIHHWSRGGWAPVSAHVGAVLLGTAAGFNLLGNLAFHTLVARKSSVSSYGVTALFLSFGVLAGVLSSGFQYATARQVLHGRTTLRDEYRKIVPWLVLVVPLGAFVVLYRPVGDFIHVDDPAALILAVLYLAITIAQAVPFGMLNGRRHFRSLTLIVFIGVSVRLVLFALLVAGHQTTVIALLASDLSTLAATVVALVIVVRFERPQPVASRRAATSTEGMVGAVLGAGLWGAWILSLVYARHYLDATSAGLFSVAHVAAGAILFLAAPIATAYVPSVAGSDRSVRPVLTGLGLTVLVCTAAVTGLVLLGRPVVRALYGSAYPPPVSLLLAQGVAASIVACATFLLWAGRSQRVRLLVHRRAFYVCVPVALVLEVLVGWRWHPSMVALALGPGLAVVTGMLCGVIVDVLWQGRRPSISPAAASTDPAPCSASPSAGGPRHARGRRSRS